ncbi:MAG TPA: hypothetical protein VGL72_04245, partial [Bryobacteraceae bacterium]
MNTFWVAVCRVAGVIGALALGPASHFLYAQSVPGNVLTISASGGTISGQIGGNSFQCPGTCTETGFDTVVLSAKADPGNYFAGWYIPSPCGIAATCTVSLASGNQNVIALFVHEISDVSACKDTAINACFGICSDPLNFSECVLGCGVANASNLQQCSTSCFTDPNCLGSCRTTVSITSTCAYTGGKIVTSPGALVLNRATQAWIQTVRVMNVSKTETMQSPSFVLDSLAAGWTLT